jgi:hypothetical protein
MVSDFSPPPCVLFARCAGLYDCVRATLKTWLKLLVKFHYLAILKNRKRFKKEEVPNSFAILQNHIANAHGWLYLYMATENQGIVLEPVFAIQILKLPPQQE